MQPWGTLQPGLCFPLIQTGTGVCTCSCFRTSGSYPAPASRTIPPAPSHPLFAAEHRGRDGARQTGCFDGAGSGKTTRPPLVQNQQHILRNRGGHRSRKILILYNGSARCRFRAFWALCALLAAASLRGFFRLPVAVLCAGACSSPPPPPPFSSSRAFRVPSPRRGAARFVSLPLPASAGCFFSVLPSLSVYPSCLIGGPDSRRRARTHPEREKGPGARITPWVQICGLRHPPDALTPPYHDAPQTANSGRTQPPTASAVNSFNPVQRPFPVPSPLSSLPA